MTDTNWKHYAVTQDGKMFLNGVDQTATRYSQNWGSCGRSGSDFSFVGNNDQDCRGNNCGNPNDASQASEITFNHLAIYDYNFDAATALAAYNGGCVPQPSASTPGAFAYFAVPDSGSNRDLLGNIPDSSVKISPSSIENDGPPGAC